MLYVIRMATSLFGISVIERHQGQVVQADEDLAAATTIQPDVQSYLTQQHVWPE